jgi:uncharacterized protein (DUF2235 family)
MSRNLVVCLDGARNEPETGPTNVTRLYDLAVKDDRQLVYYDPGVGTMGARSATTRAGRWLTRAGGLVLGHRVRENVKSVGWLNRRAQQEQARWPFTRRVSNARVVRHALADIALKWMADEAIAAGLAVDPKAYRRHVSVPPAEEGAAP